MNIEASVKASPAYWIIGVVVSIAGAAWGSASAVDKYLDSQYLQVSDATILKRDVADIKEQIKRNEAMADIGFKKNRESNLMDKILDLKTKKEMSKRPLLEPEFKQLLRYEDEYATLQREIFAKERALAK